MKKWFIRKTKNKVKAPIFTELNVHNWATKMETQRLIAGKPDLRLNVSHQYARLW